MPGPCNSRKRRQQQAKKEKSSKAKRAALVDIGVLSNEQQLQTEPIQDVFYELPKRDLSITREQDVENASTETAPTVESAGKEELEHSLSVVQQPFITDPGNGPRVKDVSAYLSSFFSIPPDLKDPICAAFTASGVLEMLMLALPREVAIITWFNKTRRVGRICPACQRLYKLGDTLLDPVTNAPLDPRDPSTPKQLLREQELSGICTAACFLLASYSSHPHIAEVTRGAWGRLEDEIDNDVYNMMGATDLTTATMILDGPARWKSLLKGGGEEFGDQGLGRVMKLTRCSDLGLRIFERR